jgi:hypothetical protein
LAGVTYVTPGRLRTAYFDRKRVEGIMNKLGVAIMVALAVIGSALALTTLYDQPANANAGVRMNLSQITASKTNLPVIHYGDHSFVPN